MFEAGLDQSAGLRRQMPKPVLRMVPVIRHSTGPSELRMLWQLCQAYVEQGLSVAVLDTDSPETEETPGLEQILSDQCTPAEVADLDLPWTIVPAALGWRALTCSGQLDAHAREALGEHFGPFGMLLIYGSAVRLGPSLANTGVRPLVPVAPEPRHMLSAYQAMKVLMEQALLMPSVAVMVTEPTQSGVMRALQTRKTLQNCFTRHMGCYLDSMTVKSFVDDEVAGRDIQMLALRLMENAIPLGAAPASLLHRPADEEVHLVRSH
ncbi:MAG: hypothetical protein EKK45_27805 [Curvibacter sp.]|nr:MAG: hypothetical protein EKK45_27805 [Curvibacter sp.]